MAKKKTNYSIMVTTSVSNRKHFITQRECADALGIAGASKAAIRSRCKVLNYEVEFDR